jgi:hypothetical protein
MDETSHSHTMSHIGTCEREKIKKCVPGHIYVSRKKGAEHSFLKKAHVLRLSVEDVQNPGSHESVYMGNN